MTQLENVDLVFHFNKAHLSDNTIPMWIIKCKGNTYYLNHVEFENVTFSTKETPDNSHTKGSLKFKRVNLSIDASNTGKVSQSS